jgi:hypothetical protein
VNLYVVADLNTMARIWVGRLPLSAAIDRGHLEVSGDHDVSQAFRSWLLLSPFAQKQAAWPGQPSPGAGRSSVASPQCSSRCSAQGQKRP